MYKPNSTTIAETSCRLIFCKLRLIGPFSPSEQITGSDKSDIHKSATLKMPLKAIDPNPPAREGSNAGVG
jgi:hypothetical protein